MDGNHSPGALHAELLEKRGRHDGIAADERVRVQQRAAADAAADDAEPTTNRLAAETHDGAAQHGTQVGHDLRDGDLCLAEAQLVRQHGRVQVLAAVAHEVEAGHEEHEVAQQQPVVLQRDLALLEEDLADAVVFRPGVGAGFQAQLRALAVGHRLREHEADDDEDGGRAGAEPEERAPAVRGGVDEAAGEGGTEEVSEGVLEVKGQ